MRRLYGSSPAHLLGHLGVLLLGGYAVIQILSLDDSLGIFLWLAGAVVLHDAILWPLYSGADTMGRRLLGPAVNHVRIPAGLSLLLALAFLSTLTGRGGDTYSHASGRQWDGYLLRWLVVTAALFAVSGIVYVIRRSR